MLKKLVKPELKARNFKSTDEDFKIMAEKAKEYTGGNVSEWIRHASVNHKPAKSELVEK